MQIFAVAFSIMSLVPSIASTILFSLPAGPAGMVWVCLNRHLALGIDVDDETTGLVDCEYFHSMCRFGIGISPSRSH